MVLRRLHRGLAVVIALFLLLHFATHLSGLAGIAAYNAMQEATRRIYRAPFIEPLLVAAILVQAVIGARLLWGIWRRGPRGRWQWAQLVSGAGVLFFLVQHLPAFAVTRFAFGLDTDFYWPASVTQAMPLNLYFTPYYFVGVVALFVHLGCALRLMALRARRPQTATLAFWGLGAAGVVTATLIVLMLLGAFFPIEMPVEWTWLSPSPAAAG